MSHSKKVAEEFIPIKEFLVEVEVKLKFFSALYLIPLFSN